MQNDYCKELEINIKKQEERREKLHNQISAHKETILKAEVSNSDLQSKIQAQNAEISSLRKVCSFFFNKSLCSRVIIISDTDIRLKNYLLSYEDRK